MALSTVVSWVILLDWVWIISVEVTGKWSYLYSNQRLCEVLHCNIHLLNLCLKASAKKTRLNFETGFQNSALAGYLALISVAV